MSDNGVSEQLPGLADIKTTSSVQPIGMVAERDRAVRQATLVLAGVAFAMLLIVRIHGTLTGPGFWTLGAMVLALAMAHGLARTGYVLPAATAAIGAPALGALIIRVYAEAWNPEAGLFLLGAAVLVLASLTMRIELAAALTVINVALAMSTPGQLLELEASAVRIPYIFIFINAVFIGFIGIFRFQDRQKIHEAERNALELERQFAQAEAEAEHRRREQVRHMRRVEALARRQRHMFDAASHEIRTPLTPILIQVAAYKRKYGADLNDDQSRSITLLERNLKRLASLIGDLLDMARMDNDKMELALAPTPLSTLIEDARETFDWQAAEKLVEILVDGDDIIAEIDATRITQVVSNLLSNAIKYSPRSGRIEVEGALRDGGIQVTVRDEGIGLTEEQRAALFQPFSQVHSGDQRIGSGLGLYISRGIVDRHGGRMWVASEGRGMGSTFGFWIPAKLSHHEHLELAQAE